jgi:hypothetical protein
MTDQADAGLARIPDACTLPAAERPGRAAEFARVLADTVRGAERVRPALLRLDLRPDPDAAARMAALAAAETACCSFFTFTMTLAGGTLTLDVSVPEQHVATLDALIPARLAEPGLGSART